MLFFRGTVIDDLFFLSLQIPEGQDCIVLTLIAPRLSPDENSGRLLGLCLDKLILLP